MLQAIGHCLESAQNHRSILSVECKRMHHKAAGNKQFFSCCFDSFYYLSVVPLQYGILTDVVEI